jgi:hypothetical protein
MCKAQSEMPNVGKRRPADRSKLLSPKEIGHQKCLTMFGTGSPLTHWDAIDRCGQGEAAGIAA